jgi:DNA-binding HxlR family transcriptional regulator
MNTCPVELGLHLIAGKWKSLILWKLSRQPVMRFGELRRAIPQVSKKMLTQQLRELERDGIISRHVMAEMPPHVEYALTEFGQTLRPIMEAIGRWGIQYEAHIRTQFVESTQKNA